MGMRPQMHLVFGIDDFPDDLRLPEDIYETQLHISDAEIEQGPYELNFLRDAFYDHRTQEWGYIADFLYHDTEFVSGVLGMSINQTGYDSDIMRVLSVFHPEYYKPGKRDLPVWEADKHPSYARDILNNAPHCADIEFQQSWFYPSVIEQHNMWPVHAYCTRWLLQQVGVDVDYHRFKAMLVWQWS